MKLTLIAKNHKHLQMLIQKEIELSGANCDLSHIDVSKVTHMNNLFCNSEFNGNISNWNLSNVESMDSMFEDSIFNNDISRWNVAKVKYMNKVFFGSKFNRNISQWNVAKVESMYQMFNYSEFSGDISDWKPLNLMITINIEEIFFRSATPIPYWANFEDQELRNKAIDSYLLNKKLNGELSMNANAKKKTKI